MFLKNTHMYYFMYIYFTKYITVLFTELFSKKYFDNNSFVTQNTNTGATYVVSDNRRRNKCFTIIPD